MEATRVIAELRNTRIELTFMDFQFALCKFCNNPISENRKAFEVATDAHYNAVKPYKRGK